MDNSLSMVVKDISAENFSIISRLDTLKNVLQNFQEKMFYEMGIMTFSRYATLEVPFTTDKILLKNVISGISPIIYGGGSDFL